MLSDRTIRAAFLISFAGHCLFLGAPGFNLRLPGETKKPEEVVVRIEIEKPPLLPRIDVMGEEKKLKEVVEKLRQPEPAPKPQLQPEEITIEDISKEPNKDKVEVSDPDQEAMLRYQDMVKQKIEEARRYPSWAKGHGIEGAVYIYFTVLPGGLSQDIKIIHSSGFKILDEEAIQTIQRAGPFPSIPQEIGVSSVQMEVAIVFALN